MKQLAPEMSAPPERRATFLPKSLYSLLTIIKGKAKAMTILRRQVLDRPGTHVFIVGVGSYPNFPKHDKTNDIGQIDSAELGARLMTKWFLEKFRNPDQPLSSIRALFSTPDSGEFNLDGLAIAAPTWKNFSTEFDNWLIDAKTSPGSTLFFYFGGHGIGAFDDQALLLEDFNESENRPMVGAANYVNLRECLFTQSKASDLWFIVDTCRNATTSQIAAQFFGSCVSTNLHLASGKNIPTVTELRSGSPGESAYGIKGKPSFFSTALTNAFQTNAFQEKNGKWCTTASSISPAVRGHLERLSKEWGLQHRPKPQGTNNKDDTVLHVLEAGRLPKMIVDITCSPAEANVTHDLYWHPENSAQTVRAKRKIASWSVDLTPNVNYFFGAIDDKSGHQKIRTQLVTTPYCEITLDIQ